MSFDTHCAIDSLAPLSPVMCPQLSAVASKRRGGASYTVSLHVPAGRTLYTGGPGTVTAVVLIVLCLRTATVLWGGSDVVNPGLM